MRTITHREMRNNSGEILRAVAAGETVQVTNHGQVAAVISPPAHSVLDQLIASGAAREARAGADALRAIRPRASKLTTKEIIDDVRGPW